MNYIKIKILFLSHSPYFNGAEIVLYNILRNLNIDKYEPIIVFPGEGEFFEKVKKMGYKTILAKLERWIRFKHDNKIKKSTIQERVLAIENIIIENEIDIVYTNTSVILEGAIAAKLCEKPHIWHIHEFLPNYNELNSIIPYPIVYKIMDYLSTYIITVSKYAASQMKDYIHDSKIKTIYNGTEINKYIEINKNLVKTNEHKNENKFNVTTIGYLTENKGYNELLEAISLISMKNINIKFTWVGNSNKQDLSKFKRKVKKLKIEKYIEYIGFSNNIPEILSKSDLLLLTSRNEAFPMVVLEAMASKLPVIATDCGGTNESIINNETGFIIPVNDPVAISSKILELYYNTEKRINFGKNGFIQFKNKFEIQKVVNEIEEILDNIYINQLAPELTNYNNNIIRSFFPLYNQISDNHWKLI